MNHTKECLLFSASIKVPHPYHVGGPRNCQVNDQPMSCPGEDQMREKTVPYFDPGDVCLHGGSSELEGNVYVGGSPVCDDNWGHEEADAVCRQLSHTRALRYTTGSRFGLVRASHSKEHFNCRGGEEGLGACQRVAGCECDSGEGAGVTCDPRTGPEIERERECFLYGLAYRATPKASTSELTGNAADCQLACQATNSCTHFSWRFAGGKCEVFILEDVPGEIKASYTSIETISQRR